MKPTVPRKREELLSVSETAARGAAQVGQDIDLKNDETAIRGDRQGLVNAVVAWERAAGAQQANEAVVRSIKTTSRDWLMLVRDNLKSRLGRSYSSAWDITGFKGSLEVPNKAGQVVVRLELMQTYLAANPNVEVEALNITGAKAEALKNDLNNAITAVTNQAKPLKDAATARDNAQEQLRNRMRWLINELLQSLGSLDTRWLVFGFTMPGTPKTPAIPGGVQAAMLTANSVAVKWDKARRAQHYRVWKKVIGVDAEFVPVGSPADLDFTIEGLPSNASVEIAISAVNTGGESPLSTVVTVQTR